MYSGDAEGGDVTFGRLGAGDAAEVHALYGTYRTSPFSVERIAALLDARGGVGARRGGRLVGFTYFQDFAPDVVELGSVFVAAPLRSSGIGSALMERTISMARAAGFRGLILSNSRLWETREPKRMARAFYGRLGFRRVAGTDDTDIHYLALAPE